MARIHTALTTAFRLTAGMVCVAMLLLAGNVARAARDLPTEPDKDYVHPASGFTFAPQVGEFYRSGVFQYDDDGLDISAGYDQKPKHIVVTAYVFACKLRKYGADLEKEFQGCEAGIRAKHIGVTNTEAGPVTLTQGERTFTGKKGVYSIEHFGLTGHAVVSELYLFIYKDNYIEFRISYPPGNKGPDEAAIATFLKTLKWP